MTTDWYKDAVIYEVQVRAFCDSNGDGKGDLAGLTSKLDYLQALGVDTIWMLPIFPSPLRDDGYDVADYTQIHPHFGALEDFKALLDAAHARGLRVRVELVINHTSDQHPWFQASRDPQHPEHAKYRDWYVWSDTDDKYRGVRIIFLDTEPSNWSFDPVRGQYFWHRFFSHQPDLNYDNPQVFNRMVDELLFLANQGVEVLRLDAVAFIWKQLGTNCENLPEAHMLIRAFNAAARISAPSLVFKSEAIVHPDDVARYIDPNECQLSYNPLLMALLWNTLATRDTRLLEHSMENRFKIHPECAWVNYVRCHDDIGWTFSDQDAAELGIHGGDHRRFLNQFYTGEFPGSFARGLPFQQNPHTGDARISGTCASLVGLEKALLEETEREVELALRRILLIHSVILSIGGIPLIYLGDEIGTLNDYSYRSDPAKARDSRWVHRPYTDWKKYELRKDESTHEGRLYPRLKRLLVIRKETTAFLGSDTEIIRSGSKQVFGYIRQAGGERVLVLANCSEQPVKIDGNEIRLYGLGYEFLNLVNQEKYNAKEPLELDSFQFAWLKVQG